MNYNGGQIKSKGTKMPTSDIIMLAILAVLTISLLIALPKA